MKLLTEGYSQGGNGHNAEIKASNKSHLTISFTFKTRMAIPAVVSTISQGKPNNPKHVKKRKLSAYRCNRKFLRNTKVKLFYMKNTNQQSVIRRY